MPDYPKPPFPDQPQAMPGETARMDPVPDHGERSYRGHGRLAGKRALITGGDSGIGRAVAIAFAREGADVAIAYLDEHKDAKDTGRLVEEAGRACLLLPGDVSEPETCRSIVRQTVEAFGGIDILVNNAAHQSSVDTLEDLTDDEIVLTFKTNIIAMFIITKAALPHMKPGASIINTASVNADDPSPQLLHYAATKGAIENFTASLAQSLAERGIRANSVAPGPIWTPLIPSTMPAEKVTTFGSQTPMKRPGQPAELAPVYVLLASDEASYVSGTMVGVTGGKPIV
jgi:NAD(P)-dependent dehydrogenase (short-subunit alcohol dehydrogenase family)